MLGGPQTPDAGLRSARRVALSSQGFHNELVVTLSVKHFEARAHLFAAPRGQSVRPLASIGIAPPAARF